jgi:hypothetical protein
VFSRYFQKVGEGTGGRNPFARSQDPAQGFRYERLGKPDDKAIRSIKLQHNGPISTQTTKYEKLHKTVSEWT